MLLACAERLRAEEWKVLGVEQLLGIGGKLVSDNTPDARNAAKKLITLLRTVYAHQVTVLHDYLLSVFCLCLVIVA